MTDDLVKRLRDTPNWMREGFQDWKDNVRTYDRAPFEAADRIEELEAKLTKAVDDLEDLVRDCEADYPPSHGAIKYLARTIIAELKGQNDE
jgi:hypothetical protein